MYSHFTKPYSLKTMNITLDSLAKAVLNKSDIDFYKMLWKKQESQCFCSKYQYTMWSLLVVVLLKFAFLKLNDDKV